jgi:hypothetical protein
MWQFSMRGIVRHRRIKALETKIKINSGLKTRMNLKTMMIRLNMHRIRIICIFH